MNNTLNPALIDAVRTVGQLLLHRPTSGVMCRNVNGKEIDINDMNAAYFCYVGACKLTDNLLLNHEVGYVDSAWGACDKVLGRMIDGTVWDSASPRTRKRWATKLANYTGE